MSSEAAFWSALFRREYCGVQVSSREASDAKHGWTAYQDEDHLTEATLVDANHDRDADQEQL